MLSASAIGILLSAFCIGFGNRYSAIGNQLRQSVSAPALGFSARGSPSASVLAFIGARLHRRSPSASVLGFEISTAFGIVARAVEPLLDAMNQLGGRVFGLVRR